MNRNRNLLPDRRPDTILAGSLQRPWPPACSAGPSPGHCPTVHSIACATRLRIFTRESSTDVQHCDPESPPRR